MNRKRMTVVGAAYACMLVGVCCGSEAYEANLRNRVFALLENAKVMGKGAALSEEQKTHAFELLHNVPCPEDLGEAGTLAQCYVHNEQDEFIQNLVRIAVIEAGLGNDEAGIESLVNQAVAVRGRQKVSAGLKQVRKHVRTQHPGPAPAGKVWSQEHGHWHDRQHAEHRLPVGPSRRADISTTGVPFAGHEDAPISVVAFIDYRCGFCKNVEATLDKLLEIYPDDIRVGIKLSPLGMNANNVLLAEAALAADAAGQFWEMHDWLYAYQGPVSIPRLVDGGVELGLEREFLETSLNRHVFRPSVEAMSREGKEVGVSGTPTVFINGRPVIGARPLEHFEKIIDQEIAGMTSGKEVES